MWKAQNNQNCTVEIIRPFAESGDRKAFEALVAELWIENPQLARELNAASHRIRWTKETK